MRRFHLFELEDQPWFPGIIRDAGTAYLSLVTRRAGQVDALAPSLSRALRKGNVSHIVDLCSGGSGPLPATLAALAANGGPPVTATLTDLYPNHEAFERMAKENPAIDAVHSPVDATSVPPEFSGLRTLFSGFHHFRPEQARQILRDAVLARQPIGVFELVARHPVAMFAMLFVPILVLFSLPLLRPFRWGWIPLTYLVPVIPLFILWDGLVSCLRCYTQDELREMTADLASDDYEWEIGTVDIAGAPFDGCYLIGWPTSPKSPAGEALETPQP
jgi:hypothetical protein